MYYTLEQLAEQARQLEEDMKQFPEWESQGNSRFKHKGITYDLSAANINMLDTIVEKGHCVVSYGTHSVFTLSNP